MKKLPEPYTAYIVMFPTGTLDIAWIDKDGKVLKHQVVKYEEVAKALGLRPELSTRADMS